MLRELAAAPVAPVAPVALDEHQAAYEPIAIPHPVPRWGPPIWSADDPITEPFRPPVGQPDLIVLSLMLAYRPE